MKIAVFHCPRGITGESALQALFDAGLPVPYLKKELGKKQVDAKTRRLVRELAKKLGKAGIGGQDALDSLACAGAVAAALGYFKVEKCFVRRIAIGKKGNPRTLKLLHGFILDGLPLLDTPLPTNELLSKREFSPRLRMK